MILFWKTVRFILRGTIILGILMFIGVGIVAAILISAGSSALADGFTRECFAASDGMREARYRHRHTRWY